MTAITLPTILLTIFISQVHDHTFFLLILYPAHNPPKSKDTLGVQEVGGTKQTSSSYGNCDLSSETNQTSPKGTRKSEDCVVNQCSTSTQEETSKSNVKRGNERTSCKKNLDSKNTTLGRKRY